MTFRPSHAWSVLACAFAMTLGGCASGGKASDAGPSSNAYSFGIWGDMPYIKNGDAPKLPALLQSLNASDIAFSVYDGDIKDGSSVCTDQVFTDALTMFNSLRKPVVYVPGDNEWTDCHRTNNGNMDPLERLSHLRKVMFPTTQSLGQNPIPLEHQAGLGQPYVENTRFRQGPVVFATFNLPGSNNNHIATPQQCSSKSKRTQADCDKAEAEYLARDAANLAWLKSTFAQAKASKALGVVVVVQAEPGFDLPETEEVDESLSVEVSGYRAFMKEVADQTAHFNGQVLFAHGDMHVFKIDKPLPHPLQPLLNFTRLSAFGSPSIHWVKVTVDPAKANLFQIEPVIVQHATR